GLMVRARRRAGLMVRAWRRERRPGWSTGPRQRNGVLFGVLHRASSDRVRLPDLLWPIGALSRGNSVLSSASVSQQARLLRARTGHRDHPEGTEESLVHIGQQRRAVAGVADVGQIARAAERDVQLAARLGRVRPENGRASWRGRSE